MKTIRVEASRVYQPTGSSTYNESKTIFNVPGPYQPSYYRENNVGVCIEFYGGRYIDPSSASGWNAYVYIDASGNSYTKGSEPDFLPCAPFDFRDLSDADLTTYDYEDLPYTGTDEKRKGGAGWVRFSPRYSFYRNKVYQPWEALRTRPLQPRGRARR